MIAYKFLGRGSVGVLSGFAWPHDEWVEVTEPLVPAERGIHACRPGDLPYWVDSELWRIELDGELLEEERMVVAGRGRLAGRVGGWDDGTMREFTLACADRVTLAGYADDAKAWAAHPGGAGPVSYIAAHAAGLEAERLARRLPARAGLASRLALRPSGRLRMTAGWEPPPGGVGWLTCAQLVELVTDYFEDRLDDGTRLRFEEHVSACGPCRGYVKQLRDTIRLTGSLDEQSIPPAARDALLSAFRDWQRET